MPAHFSTETELRQWLAKSCVPIDEIPRGVGRNQSSQHTDLVKSCHEWLMLKGVFCWRNNTGAMRIGKRLVRFSEPGMPDLLGAFPITGVLFGCECKTGTGKQTADQYDMERRFTRARALYFVVRKIEDLEKWFGNAALRKRYEPEKLR